MWPFRRKRAEVVPPVDLNTPVTNPSVLKAISELAATAGDPQLHALLFELNRANFLVATFLDEARIEHVSPGQVNFKKGSILKIMEAGYDDGRRLFPLFTDWDAIRVWTAEPVTGMVMPASDAWNFALTQNFDGVVINPGGPPLEFNRKQVQALLNVNQHS